ncbi:MAG: bestrophin family protein [Spirosomataceae bacterium]
MIIKRQFNPFKVIRYVHRELLWSIFWTTLMIWLVDRRYVTWTVPFSVVAIVGSALAIFIAFRNNSAYGRWWEARTLWGGIVNSSRVLARLVITFTDSHAHLPGYDVEQATTFKRVMVYRIIAWAHALRIQLRGQDTWEELQPFMTAEEYERMLTAGNQVNLIQLHQGKAIYEAMRKGILAGFDSFQLEGQLLALANYQGGCERIKRTPLLRQYDYFTRIFLWTFIALLPWSLVPDLAKTAGWVLSFPISVLISFVFSILGKVGEVNEDPFENRITDVPMTAICGTIERDLLDMLGESSLPKTESPYDGYLY